MNFDVRPEDLPAQMSLLGNGGLKVIYELRPAGKKKFGMYLVKMERRKPPPLD